MFGKSVGVSLIVLCLSQPAFAQDLNPTRHFAGAVTRATPAGRDTLDASMARLAVKAAFQPSMQPSQRELLGVILLMSLRPERASGT